MESTFEKIVMQNMHMLHMHIPIIIIAFVTLLVNFFMLCSPFLKSFYFQVWVNDTIGFVRCQHFFANFFIIFVKKYEYPCCKSLNAGVLFDSYN